MVSIVSVSDGKANLVVGVTKNLVKSINAIDLVKSGGIKLGGRGGGGRPDMAQAGGPNTDNGQEALDKIIEELEMIKN